MSGIARRRGVTTVAAVAVEQMHQRACQQQQINPVASNMAPVLAQEVETADQGDHDQCNFQGPAQCDAFALRTPVRARQVAFRIPVGQPLRVAEVIVVGALHVVGSFLDSRNDWRRSMAFKMVLDIM